LFDDFIQRLSPTFIIELFYAIACETTPSLSFVAKDAKEHRKPSFLHTFIVDFFS
jgi:hypothetical protein